MSDLRRSIAFLRAINVGGHTVKMADLRAHFAALGFANVATFIASGNVVFDAPPEDARAIEQRIERQLEQALGYAVATFIRSPGELAAVAAYQPFPSTNLAADSALSIAFLRTEPAAEARRKLLALRTPIDDFHVHGRELYWLRRTRIGESRFSGAVLEKTLGMPATIRNVTTVRKLAEKYRAPR